MKRLALALAALLLAQPAHAQLFRPAAATLADVDGLRAPLAGSFDFSGGTLPPGATLTRASTGWAFNASNVLTSYAVDLPRFEYAENTGLRGLWNEPAATDVVRNSSAIGAVPGTPGTAPTNWTIPAAQAGHVLSVAGSGTEAGVPYLDLRWTGNRGSNSVYTIDLETSPGPAAVQGDIWAALGFAKAIVTTGGVQAVRLSAAQINAGGGLLSTLTIGSAVPPQTGGNLPAGTLSGAATISDPLTASMRPRWTVTILAGDVDATVRLGLPTFFRSTDASAGWRNSPIVTTTAAVTRAADVLKVPLADGTYDVALTVMSIGVLSFPNQVVTGGLYTVPNTNYPLRSIAASRTGP